MKHPVARYLMCAYAYYEKDDPLISDKEFDDLSKWLLINYDNIEHPHKKLISKDDLNAGTYLGEYPEMVKGAVNSWKTNYTSGQRKTMMKQMLNEQDRYIRKSTGTLEDFF